MGMDLVFEQIEDGEKKQLKSFGINFLRDLYPTLVEMILYYSTIRNSNCVAICPSTKFMTIYENLDNFCKEKTIELKEKQAELIKAIRDEDDDDDDDDDVVDDEDEDEFKLRPFMDKYFELRGCERIDKSDVNRIQDIMKSLKEYSNTNAYLYLSF